MDLAYHCRECAHTQQNCETGAFFFVSSTDPTDGSESPEVEADSDMVLNFQPHDSNPPDFGAVDSF